VKRRVPVLVHVERVEPKFLEECHHLGPTLEARSMDRRVPLQKKTGSGTRKKNYLTWVKLRAS
jgi:hypothetical protein